MNPSPPRPDTALRQEVEALRNKVALLEMVVTAWTEDPGKMRETMRAPAASHHDWSVDGRVDRILTDRVRDPRDPMTSDRAAAIATQVIEAVKNADDAKELHVRKDRLARILAEVLVGLILFAAGLFAAKLGWRQ